MYIPSPPQMMTTSVMGQHSHHNTYAFTCINVYTHIYTYIYMYIYITSQQEKVAAFVMGQHFRLGGYGMVWRGCVCCSDESGGRKGVRGGGEARGKRAGIRRGQGKSLVYLLPDLPMAHIMRTFVFICIYICKVAHMYVNECLIHVYALGIAAVAASSHCVLLVYICTYMYEYMYIHIYIYVCVHVYVYIYIHIYMYVHI